MGKFKFVIVAAFAALVAVFALSACGGQAASSSSKASSTSKTTTSSSSSTSAAQTIVSWQGALADGKLIDYIESNDGKNAGLVITASAKAEPKKWLGAKTATSDGKVTITDDTTKETINLTLTGVTKDGAVLVDIEGYGKGAVVPMTADDWKKVAEAEELAKALGTVVNWVGVFEDGSLMAYMSNDAGTQAAVAIAKKGSNEMKTWTGKVTTADGNKLTVTDDKTGQAITFTATKVAQDGTLTVESDGYGKGVLVQMTVADYVALDEIVKASRK